MAAPTLVRFMSKCRPYNVGEVAGFDPESALFQDMLKRGIVVLIPEEEAAKIREKAAAQAAPPADTAAQPPVQAEVPKAKAKTSG